MAKAEFDQFANTYRAIHQVNIALTGEEPEYFADYKMRDFAARLVEIGAPATGRYLDFGSGIGASVAPFMKHLPLAQLVCADVSAESLAQSRQVHGDSVGYVVIDSGSLPIEDHSLDGAFACCVFHHIPHELHGQVLAEVRRVLKPGAPLMVYEHNPLNPLTVRAVKTCPLDENAVLIPAGHMLDRCAAQGFGAARIEYRVFFPATFKRLRFLESRLRWLPLGAQYAVHAVA